MLGYTGLSEHWAVRVLGCPSAGLYWAVPVLGYTGLSEHWAIRVRGCPSAVYTGLSEHWAVRVPEDAGTTGLLEYRALKHWEHTCTGTVVVCKAAFRCQSYFSVNGRPITSRTAGDKEPSVCFVAKAVCLRSVE